MFDLDMDLMLLFLGKNKLQITDNGRLTPHEHVVHANLHFSMCYQNYVLSNKSFNVKSHLGNNKLLLVIRNSVSSGYVLTNCHCTFNAMSNLDTLDLIA